MTGVPASNLYGKSAGVKPSVVTLFDHAAAAEEGRHAIEQVFAAIEHADAGGAEHLVAAEGEKIDIASADIDRLVRNGLRRVDRGRPRRRRGRLR